MAMFLTMVVTIAFITDAATFTVPTIGLVFLVVEKIIIAVVVFLAMMTVFLFIGIVVAHQNPSFTGCSIHFMKMGPLLIGQDPKK